MDTKKSYGLIVVLLLCLVFPLVSWYYMKQGFGYRKQVLNELSTKIEIDTTSIDSVDLAIIKNKVAIINLHGNKDNIFKILEQFKSTGEFVLLSTPGYFSPTLEHKSHQYFERIAGESKYLIIDNGGLVRYKYSDTQNDMKLMVKHIATLIPFVEKKKKMK
jgi:hypothetical protein